MFDVVIQHLRKEEQRLVGSDGKSEADRQRRRKHSLRERHQPRRDRAAEVEQRLMARRVEIDVDVTHQLRQLRRLAIFPHHLRADADDPQEFRLFEVAQVDLLNAGGAFH